MLIDRIPYNLNKNTLTAKVISCSYLPGNNKFILREGAVVIPDTLSFRGQTYKVTAIDNGAFATLDIYSITIPNSVTYIGESAFDGCKILNSVKMPNSITTIEKRAFANCKDLTSVVIPEKCEHIGDLAFAWSGVEDITIGKNLKSIGNKVFFKCRLQNVHYPQGKDLKDMDIPSTVHLLAFDTQNSPYRQKELTESHQQVTTKVEKPDNQEIKDPSIAQEIPDVDVNIPIVKSLSPTTFAIIFANEDYKNVASVPFAKNDGLIFQKYCQKTLGIPSINIHYVENASYNDIRIQLAWLKDVCDAYDGNASVIIYYAGHGIPDEASKSAYLLPVDGDGRYVQSAYKVDDLYQQLGTMKAKSITVFMDACFSGSKREEGMLASARGVALKAKSGVPQGNMVVFSAAQGDETAYPDNDEKHGMFTYYLLKKLQETKGNVTLQELGNYIITNVRQQSIVKNGKPQTPCVTPSASVGTEWQSWKLK